MSLEHVDVRVRKCAGPFYYFKGKQASWENSNASLSLPYTPHKPG